MTLRQRQPRIEDAAHLAYVRTLPCLVCKRPGPNDPAHLRSPALQYGKRYTGKGEKPDDKWTVPLCRKDHDDQHRRNELLWWASKGIPDPFAVAKAIYASRPGASQPRPRKAPKVRVRKPSDKRHKVAVGRRLPKGRPMESRSNFPPAGTRKLGSPILRKSERTGTT